MTTPQPKREQPSFEGFKLGWRIPPAVLEPLLHPVAAAEPRDPAPAAPAASHNSD
jgi:hypothetical protein